MGIAGGHIRDDVHLGCHNNTIGYHSDSGVVVSSHCSRSQTKPPKYTVGKQDDVFVTRNIIFWSLMWADSLIINIWNL